MNRNIFGTGQYKKDKLTLMRHQYLQTAGFERDYVLFRKSGLFSFGIDSCQSRKGIFFDLRDNKNDYGFDYRSASLPVFCLLC